MAAWLTTGSSALCKSSNQTATAATRQRQTDAQHTYKREFDIRVHVMEKAPEQVGLVDDRLLRSLQSSNNMRKTPR